jgi:hypothetical protein
VRWCVFRNPAHPCKSCQNNLDTVWEWADSAGRKRFRQDLQDLQDFNREPHEPRKTELQQKSAKGAKILISAFSLQPLAFSLRLPAGDITRYFDDMAGTAGIKMELERPL